MGTNISGGLMDLMATGVVKLLLAVAIAALAAGIDQIAKRYFPRATWLRYRFGERDRKS